MAGRVSLTMVAALAALLATGVLTGAARAQISADQIRQRYEKNTKGANMEDYLRRFNSDDADKRLEGIKSIGESKDERALEYLLQGLGDPDLRVKAKAIDALGNIRATEATPVLVQHLFLRSTAESVKRRILASMGKIGDARAAPSIVEFLQRDLDPNTRATAIYALGEIGSADAIQSLTQIEQTDQHQAIRRLAGEAVNKVRYHQSVVQAEVKEPRLTFLQEDNNRPAQ